MADSASPALGSRRPLDGYVAAGVTVGAIVLVNAGVAAVRTPHPVAWLALSALALVAGFCKLQFAGLSADIAIDDTFFIATALLYGPGPATLAFAASGLACRFRKTLRPLVF